MASLLDGFISDRVYGSRILSLLLCTLGSVHFMNSVGRRLRKNEFPTLNLPVLHTSATVPAKRKSPRKRCETSREIDDETSEESD